MERNKTKKKMKKKNTIHLTKSERGISEKAKVKCISKINSIYSDIIFARFKWGL